MKTSKRTGIVTCDNVAEVGKAQRTIRAASGERFFVVDRNRRTATNGNGDTIDLSKAEWPVEPGQVIDPVAKKPLVGDYDLMAVIDPNAKGRNLALAVDNTANEARGNPLGTLTDDFTTSDIKKVAAEINRQLDQDRVLHGSQEAFDSLDNLAADEMVVGFFPDGATAAFNRPALKNFYESIGRSTLDLKRFLDQ